MILEVQKIRVEFKAIIKEHLFLWGPYRIVQEEGSGIEDDSLEGWFLLGGPQRRT